MRAYELTVVIPGSASAAKVKSTKELITKLLKVFDGKVLKEDNWGKKELSYLINREDSGVYLHYLVELKPETVSQLDNKLTLEDSVLRHLLVKAESKVKATK